MVSERNSEGTGKTREAILAATEKIMREEGYAAVSSRRVADEAGLKSQLVHYHFGAMDDLFLALFQRFGARYFDRHVQAMTSSDPLRALWDVIIDRKGMDLILEIVALSNHRKAIRKEIARFNAQTRSMQVALLTRALEQRGIPPDVCPPNVLSVLMSGVALALATEEAIGNSEAHADTIAFVERLIAKTLPLGTPTKAGGRRRKKRVDS